MSNKLKIILAVITSILVLSGSAIIFNSQRRNSQTPASKIESSSSSSTISSAISSQVSSVSISSSSVESSSVLSSEVAKIDIPITSQIVNSPTPVVERPKSVVPVQSTVNPIVIPKLNTPTNSCNIQPKDGMQIVYSSNNCFGLIVNERYNRFTADNISLIQLLKNQYQRIATNYFVNSNLTSGSKISIDLTRYISPNTVQVDVSTIDLNYNKRTEALTTNQKTYTLANNKGVWKVQ